MLSWTSRIAAQVLLKGGIIAYPTEAVWGLGCLPDNERGVNRILELKHRSVDKGLILVAASMDQLSPYLEGLSENDLVRLSCSWPGPVTWLIPDNGSAPPWVRGNHQTVAVRVSSHPVIAHICNCVGSAIVSTSANVAGRPPIREILKVRKQFGQSVDYIQPGELGCSKNVTEIKHLREDRVVRHG